MARPFMVRVDFRTDKESERRRLAFRVPKAHAPAPFPRHRPRPAPAAVPRSDLLWES